MSAWGAGVCVFFRGRRRLSPPPPLLNKELREEVLGFPTLAHPGSSPSSFDLPLSMTGRNVNHHQSSADGSVTLPSMEAPGLSLEGSINRVYLMDILTNGASFSCWLCPPPLISHFTPVDFFPSYSASSCLFLSPSLI